MTTMTDLAVTAYLLRRPNTRPSCCLIVSLNSCVSSPSGAANVSRGYANG